MNLPPCCEHILFHAPPQGEDIAHAAPVPARRALCSFEVVPDDLPPGGAPVNHYMAKVAEELAVELLIRDDRIEVPVDGERECIIMALWMANEDSIPGQGRAGSGVDLFPYPGQGDRRVTLAQYPPTGGRVELE